MRKLLTVAVGVVVGTVAAAYAAGPVYTIPADYEKMKKVVEGLAGTTNLSTLSDTQAQNAGANVKAFVEGATGKSTTSTYSPTYFRYYGANYRNFVWGAANADPGSSTNNALFKTVGNNYRNFTVNAAGVGVQDGRTYLFQFAGRNYRNLAQGLTGLGITDYRYYYYNYAGRNVKNLAEGQTGLSIRDYRYWYYRNAGANYKSLAQGLANGQSITYDPYSSYNNYQQTKMQQFKQRADQTFYDMYLNPNGMKKAFTTMDTSITSKTAGLTPISTNNKAEFDGASGGIVAAKTIIDAADTYYPLTYFVGIPSGYPSAVKKIPYQKHWWERYAVLYDSKGIVAYAGMFDPRYGPRVPDELKKIGVTGGGGLTWWKAYYGCAPGYKYIGSYGLCLRDDYDYSNGLIIKK